ncbi:unnamed protein product [Spirodela intermedia]|uniref:F-box domain-containing protein n=1 Tax=Spirodela intermedia TaxID=51605 RepID=A0A7I8KTR1_SPIIN|nr:unnamed protein product [Spirodela intermedia]
MAAAGSRKRRWSLPGPEVGEMNLEDLHQDLLEKILSWLPASSFFRLRSVCKRWRSAESSATFLNSCSGIASREPWFLMVDPDVDQSVVFDTSEGNWKNIGHPALLRETRNSNSIPVASSGGLVCFLTTAGSFIVCNPVTGACRELPPMGLGEEKEKERIYAIAMTSSPYKLFVISGDFPNIRLKIYDSAEERWEEAQLSGGEPHSTAERDVAGDETVYFLSKAGEVVATNTQRSPSKQYSSVITTQGGELHMFFLSSGGAVVGCNLTQRSFSEYPRLLPVHLEHSFDVVEYMGELMVVALSEFLESASLRVWRFCKDDQLWHQVAAMPPAMSHELHGKQADVNCVGLGDAILVCVSSAEFSRHIVCNLPSGRWSELPECSLRGTNAGELRSAFSFEPRLEARV